VGTQPSGGPPSIAEPPEPPIPPLPDEVEPPAPPLPDEVELLTMLVLEAAPVDDDDAADEAEDDVLPPRAPPWPPATSITLPPHAQTVSTEAPRPTMARCARMTEPNGHTSPG